MPRRVKVEGVTHVFPDDATDEEVSAAVNAAHPPPVPASPPSNTSRFSSAFGESFPLNREMLSPHGEMTQESVRQSNEQFLPALQHMLSPGEDPSLAQGDVQNLVHAIPFIGPPISQVLSDIRGGQWPEAFGHAAGAGTGGALMSLGMPGAGGEGAGEVRARSPLTMGEPMLPKLPFEPLKYGLARRLSSLRLQSPVEVTPPVPSGFMDPHAGFDMPTPADRGAPVWSGMPEPVQAAPPPFSSIPAAPRPVKLTPESRTPAWSGMPEPSPASLPDLSPIQSGGLPSGRAVGKPDPMSAPLQPIQPPAPVTTGTPVPPNAETFEHPASHTDVRRMIHSVGQQLDLGPESPAGANAHKLYSSAAKKLFGVKSSADLSYEQDFVLNEFLLKNKRFPTSVTDLKSGLK